LFLPGRQRTERAEVARLTLLGFEPVERLQQAPDLRASLVGTNPGARLAAEAQQTDAITGAKGHSRQANDRVDGAVELGLDRPLGAQQRAHQAAGVETEDDLLVSLHHVVARGETPATRRRAPIDAAQL